MRALRGFFLFSMRELGVVLVEADISMASYRGSRSEFNSNHLLNLSKGCDVSEDGSKALLTLGAGDMRKVLNILQRYAQSL